MESKKNQSKDIHKRYPLHLVAGLCISCGLVILAFEMKFKNEPPVIAEPYDWDDAMAFIDPITLDPPEAAKQKQATPMKVVRAALPATIEVALAPVQESAPIQQEDPFDEEPQPASSPAGSPVVPDDPFVFADVMPEPENGFEGFYKQLARDLRYPRGAIAAGVEGKVFVEFVIDQDGSPTHVKVIRGIGSGCDEEAMKALMKTRWTPGRQEGRLVRVRMIMPVQFSLTK